MISVFEEKKASQNGHRIYSMTRMTVFLFTLAETFRLVTVDTISWAEMVIATFILLALPLNSAFNRATPDTVVERITEILKPGQHVEKT